MAHDRALIRRRWDGESIREVVHDDPPKPRGQLVPRRIRRIDARAPVVVPLLRASCDGSGACCGLYHHVPATTADRDRIVAALEPTWDRPVALQDVFHPAFAGRENPLNVVAIGGSCAFLEGDGRCAVHAAAGATSKPQSCLSYPAHLVACGAEWHASLRAECACIARSAIEGTALGNDPDVWVRLRSTMPRVWAVPRNVAIDHRTVPRGDYVAWLRATVAKLKTTFDLFTALDAARAELWALVGEEVEPIGEPEADWVATVADHLTAEAADAAQTFEPGSPYRRSIAWGAEVARSVAAAGVTPPAWSRGKAGDWARRAASTVSLHLHGHTLLERPRLGPAFDDLVRAMRMARAGEGIRAAEDVDHRLEAVTMWLFLLRNVWL